MRSSWTCHLCALQIQKLSEHKVIFVQLLFAKSWKKWTCHQSVSARSPLKQQKITDFFVHRKGLANISDLAPKSPNHQKLDMSPLCSKQSISTFWSWTQSNIIDIFKRCICWTHGTHLSLVGLVKSSRATFNFNDERLLLLVGPASAAATTGTRELGVN